MFILSLSRPCMAAILLPLPIAFCLRRGRVWPPPKGSRFQPVFSAFTFEIKKMSAKILTHFAIFP